MSNWTSTFDLNFASVNRVANVHFPHRTIHLTSICSNGNYPFLKHYLLRLFKLLFNNLCIASWKISTRASLTLTPKEQFASYIWWRKRFIFKRWCCCFVIYTDRDIFFSAISQKHSNTIPTTSQPVCLHSGEAVNS